MAKTAGLYARISIATEESVSVARQLEAGRRYTQAPGWVVVGEFVDEGGSATTNKPDARVGWRGVLNSLLARGSTTDVVDKLLWVG